MTAYRFVAPQEADGLPVTMTCQVAGVSIFAYYDWKQHREGVVSVGDLKGARLVDEIKTTTPGIGNIDGDLGDESIHMALLEGREQYVVEALAGPESEG